MRSIGAPNLTPIFAGGLALVAFVLGTNLVTSRALVLPLTIQATILLLATLAALRGETDPRLRSWLIRLVVAALAARFLAFVVVHYSFPAYFFAVDSVAYERLGAALSLHWQDLGPEPVIRGRGWLPSYYHLNAAFHMVLGESAVGVIVLNMFAGVWVSVLTFYLTREVLGEQAAKIAAILTAFFPSMILWSVLNIRDALATFAVTLTVFYGVKAFRKPLPGRLILLAVGLLLLSSLRDYMGFLVLCGLILGSVAAVRPGRLVATLVSGTIVVLFLALLADQLQLFPAAELEDPLATASQMRSALQYGATSAYGSGYETDTIAGTLRFLPLGLSFLLFAPFPWAIESTLQASAAPETLLWYPLFLAALAGMRYGVVKAGNLNVIPLAVLIVVTTSYALVEGNFGTAYRHRAQIMPLFFVFSSAGLILFRARMQKGRKKRQQFIRRRGADADVG